MEGEISNTIVKLKTLLKEKYGENFREFYLSNHNEDGNWTGLLDVKVSESRTPAEYYKIKDNDVVVVD